MRPGSICNCRGQGLRPHSGLLLAGRAGKRSRAAARATSPVASNGRRVGAHRARHAIRLSPGEGGKGSGELTIRRQHETCCISKEAIGDCCQSRVPQKPLLWLPIPGASTNWMNFVVQRQCWDCNETLVSSPQVLQWETGPSGACAAHIVAPCPHEGACPMDGTRSWCHFSQNFERTRLQRQAKVQLGRRLPGSHQDERFSYVVLRRGTRPPLPADVALPEQLDWQASPPHVDVCLKRNRLQQ